MNQSFLRWAGSKKQILSILGEYWNDEYRYIEPFAGSACFFFYLQPNKAILNDINKELILTYREVKYRLPNLVNCLSKFKTGRSEYYKVRSMDQSKMTAIERAARFIYLNRLCYNGLYRTNSAGIFNVPYGGNDKKDIIKYDILKSCSRSLKNAKLMSKDFERVLEISKKGDFVYMDPPFSTNQTRVFKEYYNNNFGVEDIIRLRNWMEILDMKSVKFIVSYGECHEANILKNGFYVRKVNVRRNISGFIKGRKIASELLINNIK